MGSCQLSRWWSDMDLFSSRGDTCTANRLSTRYGVFNQYHLLIQDRLLTQDHLLTRNRLPTRYHLLTQDHLLPQDLPILPSSPPPSPSKTISKSKTNRPNKHNKLNRDKSHMIPIGHLQTKNSVSSPASVNLPPTEALSSPFPLPNVLGHEIYG